MFRRWNRRGGNAIEVALTMPVFLAGMFGLMDYGWYFYNEAMTIEATRQGCRLGSVVPEANTNPTLEQVAGEYISDELVNLGVRAAGSEPAQTTGLFSTSDTSERINMDVTTSGGVAVLECNTYLTFTPLVGFVPTPGHVHSAAVFSLEQPT